MNSFLSTKKYLFQKSIIIPLIVHYVLDNCVKNIFKNKKYFKSMVMICKGK